MAATNSCGLRNLVGGGLPGGGRFDQRAGNLHKIAIGRGEGFFQMFDKIGRRLIGDKMAGELRRDEAGRGRVPGEIGKNSLSLLDATLGINTRQHLVSARFMPIRIERERAAGGVAFFADVQPVRILAKATTSACV